MQRREFIFALSGLALGFACRSAFAANKVVIMQFSDDGKLLGAVTLDKVEQDREWKKRLSPLAYHVTREQGTEAAFSVPGYDRHEPGLYRCVCCDNALFNAATKFDSGTGWPSFWQPVAPQNVREIADHLFGMTRTEVRCVLCDAHLGHVFNDGPKPTGLRYCMNSVAMKFLPNGHGKNAIHDNEARHARSPLFNSPPHAGERANVSLREFNVKWGKLC